MLPTRQGLHAGDAAGAQVENRLVPHADRLTVDRGPQPLLHQPAGLELLADRIAEDADALAAGGLAGIEAEIGEALQIRGGCRMFGRESDADRDAHMEN